VTALAQYYDPPLKCFTFLDFQLVPIVEEFKQIMDIPLEESIPYEHVGQPTSISTLAKTMKMPMKELESKVITLNDTKGFPQGFLERRLHKLIKEENWKTFMDVFALSLYEILLFLKIEHFVDYSTINAFIAFEARSKNPGTAILADVYLTLDSCHSRMNMCLVCCWPILYVWVVARFKERVVGVKCPVESIIQQRLDKRSKQGWARYFADLT